MKLWDPQAEVDAVVEPATGFLIFTFVITIFSGITAVVRFILYRQVQKRDTERRRRQATAQLAVQMATAQVAMPVAL